MFQAIWLDGTGGSIHIPDLANHVVTKINHQYTIEWFNGVWTNQQNFKKLSTLWINIKLEAEIFSMPNEKKLYLVECEWDTSEII